jgi:hypothetical protein
LARVGGCWGQGDRMSVVVYRCPASGKEVTRTIEANKDTLVKMGEMKLTIWLSCPHCAEGHQINPANAVLKD